MRDRKELFRVVLITRQTIKIKKVATNAAKPSSVPTNRPKPKNKPVTMERVASFQGAIAAAVAKSGQTPRKP